jgi:hypothetical protein
MLAHFKQHFLGRPSFFMFNFFPSYHLEHPNTHQSLLLDGQSYVLAGLLASFFVLSSAGLRAFPKAALINIAVVLVALMSILVSPFLPGLFKLVGLVAVPTVLAVLQSRLMIKAVRRHFARQGWIVTRA